MPQPKKGPRLASSPAHERLMLANMATSLYEHGQIKTTLPKAKRLRPLAERLITFAKRGDLNSRRRVLRIVRNKSVVHKLFTEIAQQMEQREGGYTRIIKIAPRQGDSAPMAVIELVTESVSARRAAVKEAEAAAKSAAKLPENAGEADKAKEGPEAGAETSAAEKADAKVSDKTAEAAGTKPAAKKPAAKKADKADDTAKKETSSEKPSAAKPAAKKAASAKKPAAKPAAKKDTEKSDAGSETDKKDNK